METILHRHARIAEIRRIPRGHGQAMREGGGGDEAVFYRHGAVSNHSRRSASSASIAPSF